MLSQHDIIEGAIIYSGCETIPGGERLHDAFYRLSMEFPECFESRRIYFDTNGPRPRSDEVDEHIGLMSYTGILEPVGKTAHRISDSMREEWKKDLQFSEKEIAKLTEIGQKMGEILEDYERI